MLCEMLQHLQAGVGHAVRVAVTQTYMHAVRDAAAQTCGMEAGDGVHTCGNRGELCRLLQYTIVRAGACCDTECKGRVKLCKICDHQMCGG
jgi:hypothetical protein